MLKVCMISGSFEYDSEESLSNFKDHLKKHQLDIEVTMIVNTNPSITLVLVQYSPIRPHGYSRAADKTCRGVRISRFRMRDEVPFSVALKCVLTDGMDGTRQT